MRLSSITPGKEDAKRVNDSKCADARTKKKNQMTRGKKPVRASFDSVRASTISGSKIPGVSRTYMLG